jgi:hypothetical protein
MTRTEVNDVEGEADSRSYERQYELMSAYHAGKAAAEGLLEQYRPLNLKQLTEAPDYMKACSQAINAQPCDRTGTAAMHGFLTAFVTEILVLHQACQMHDIAVETEPSEVH